MAVGHTFVVAATSVVLDHVIRISVCSTHPIRFFVSIKALPTLITTVDIPYPAVTTRWHIFVVPVLTRSGCRLILPTWTFGSGVQKAFVWHPVTVTHDDFMFTMSGVS
jgi:hypothetical protein